MNDLLFSIGLDVSDLRTSARAAKEQADDIKKGFKGFKDVLEFGGVGAAVFGFFKAVVDHARNAKGELDENTAAVKRFADGIDEAKNTALGWGAQLVGFFNRAGEGLGMMIRSMIDGKEAVKQAAKTEREAAEAIAKIEAEKKKNGEEYKRITEQIATLEKESVQIREKGLTTQEQFNLAAQRLEEIEKKRSAEGLTQIEQRRLDLELQKAAVDVLKLDAALSKENAEEAKKTAEAESKAREKHNDLVEKKLKLQFEAMSTDEKIGKLAKDEEALRKTIVDFKRMGLDPSEQEVALLETQAQLGKLRTEQTKEATAATEELAEEESQITKEIEAQIARRQAALAFQVREGREDTALSDRELAEKIKTVAADLESRRIAVQSRADGLTFDWVNVGDRFNQPEQYDRLFSMVKDNLAAAMAEQRTRQQFRELYAREGESAFKRYSAFDEERLRQYIRPEDEKRAAQQAKDIADIAARLANLVPKS
jgi:hypothetical protein